MSMDAGVSTIAMPIAISSALDGGNIRVLAASSPADVRLEIVPEPYTDADQTTHFQLGEAWGLVEGRWGCRRLRCLPGGRPTRPPSLSPPCSAGGSISG